MYPNIDTATLRAFLAVAETGGFTAAARKLFRTQAAVSVQVKKLEDVLSVQLFARNPEGAVLTPAGESFVSYARRIVELHDLAIESMRGDPISGTARIAVMDDYPSILPSVLADFSRRNPAVQLEITTGFTSKLLDGLGEQFDLVLATQQIGSARGHILKLEQIAWAFSSTHDLPELNPVPLAVMPVGNPFRTWALNALNKAGIRWRIAMTTTSIAAAEAAAAAGMAISVIKAGNARSNLRLLGAADGLPELPVVEIALHEAPGRLPDASFKLSQFLKSELKA